MTPTGYRQCRRCRTENVYRFIERHSAAGGNLGQKGQGQGGESCQTEEEHLSVIISHVTSQGVRQGNQGAGQGLVHKIRKQACVLQRRPVLSGSQDLRSSSGAVGTA